MSKGDSLSYFFRKSNDEHFTKQKKDYVPSHERPGYHEGLVEVLPTGFASQRKDYWGHLTNTRRAWNQEKPREDDDG